MKSSTTLYLILGVMVLAITLPAITPKPSGKTVAKSVTKSIKSIPANIPMIDANGTTGQIILGSTTTTGYYNVAIGYQATSAGENATPSKKKIKRY